MLLEKQAHSRPPAESMRPALDPELVEFSGGSEAQAWLRCVVSDTAVELLDRWITDFQRFHPEIRIDTFIGGSAAAGPALAGGWADMAVVARELAPSEGAEFERQFGYPITRIEVGGGSLRTLGYTDTTVVIVNEKNPLEAISLPMLAAIYGEARPDRVAIETWGQLGIDESWAGRRMNLWAPKAENGFGHFVRERVLHDGRFRAGISVRDRVNPIPAAVAADPYAMGIVGLGHVVPGTKVLALSTKDGEEPIMPTLDNVASRRYPLGRSIYLMVNRAPESPLAPPIELFARYLLSASGQQTVLDDGIFLPLTAEVANQELARLPDHPPVSRLLR